MSLGKHVFIFCIIQTLAYFAIFSASGLENLQRNSGWRDLGPLSTTPANLGPCGDTTAGLSPLSCTSPLLHFPRGSCSSPSFLTMKDVGFSVPHNLLLIPEAKGIQELRSTHTSSKYGRELKTNKDPKGKGEHKNGVRLQNKHCFFAILLHGFRPFCNKNFIQDFFPHCNLPLHHPYIMVYLFNGLFV